MNVSNGECTNARTLHAHVVIVKRYQNCYQNLWTHLANISFAMYNICHAKYTYTHCTIKSRQVYYKYSPYIST